MQLTRLKFLVIAFLLVVTTSASANQALKSNEVLLGAMSPFEDMIEFTLAGNDSNISKALATADQHATNVKTTLSASAASKFATLMDDLHKATARKDHHKVARRAVEIFRLLSDNLQAEVLDVPKEVSLLDYAGFKLRVLAATQKPDWRDIRKTVYEATGWWSAINSKVSEKGLRNAFGTLIRGLEDAAKIDNLPMLRFAAQMDLDLVDLLEGDLKPKR
jgi:hypothetical protein